METYAIYPRQKVKAPEFILPGVFATMSGESREFNSLLFTAVDKALAESLGDSMSGAIKACIPVTIITTNPKGFATKLEKMTGGTKTCREENYAKPRTYDIRTKLKADYYR